MTGIGLIFLVAGVGLVIGCFFAVSRTKRFLSTAREVRGQVVGIESRRGRGQHASRMHYPVLRYRTQEGTQHEVVSSVGSNPPRYKEGDSVTLLYDPQNPLDARIHTFLNVWLFPVVLGGVGGAFVLVGGVLALMGGMR